MFRLVRRGIERRKLVFILVEGIIEEVCEFVQLGFVLVIVGIGSVHLLVEEIIERVAFIGGRRIKHLQAFVFKSGQTVGRVC